MCCPRHGWVRLLFIQPLLRPLVGASSASQPNTQRCLCHGFRSEASPPGTYQEAQKQVEWNSDFSTWLPRYRQCKHPCEYCHSLRLECFIFNDAGAGDDSAGCSACNALFRSCSFTAPKHQQRKSKTALDTLDIVDEDRCGQFGGLTGKYTMRSLGHVGPMEDEDQPSSKKNSTRFPHSAVKVLKDWMRAHAGHPYPTDQEKQELQDQTGLGPVQISNWMANTRRRQKSCKKAVSPSMEAQSEAIRIPHEPSWESMNPLERWKYSPPEHDFAPITAIAKAAKDYDPPEPSAGSNVSSSGRHKGVSNGSSGSFSVFRAPSTTSLETGLTKTSSESMQSQGTAWSYGSHPSFGSLNSGSKKGQRRRRHRVPVRPRTAGDDASASHVFRCTFCTDAFKSKYDWSRHEKSLHLSLEKWICAPLGDVLTWLSSGQRMCVFCDARDPSPEHLESHNYRACEEKGLEARTFYRKDHLRQHLRLMHACKMTASMESWKSEAQQIQSRCGFCDARFESWHERVDHLAKEFRNGATMRAWKGCRGFETSVAAHVSNAMPPYLIANESKSPLLFSATRAGSAGSAGNAAMLTSTADALPASATCWEMLTLRLGRFAREHAERDGLGAVTDDVLQREARQILYESDDAWNQTAADNPEWLALFRKAHGLPSSDHLAEGAEKAGPSDWGNAAWGQLECFLTGSAKLSREAGQRNPGLWQDAAPKRLSPPSTTIEAPSAGLNTPLLGTSATMEEFPAMLLEPSLGVGEAGELAMDIDSPPAVQHETGTSGPWHQASAPLDLASVGLAYGQSAFDVASGLDHEPGLPSSEVDRIMTDVQWEDGTLGLDFDLPFP